MRYKVTDGFWCQNNSLQDLVGSPEFIRGSFLCQRNYLSTLEGVPKDAIVHHFNCSSNNLISLEGCPKRVSGNFRCHSNPKTFTKDDVLVLAYVGGRIITNEDIY